jgi:hypothetical protein
MLEFFPPQARRLRLFDRGNQALTALFLLRPGPFLVTVKNDGHVKNPSAALRCILRSLRRTSSTPHSSGLARLAYGALYMAVHETTFYEIIKI